MIRNKEVGTQAFKIGLWGIVAAVCIFIGLNVLKGSSLFKNRTTYYIYLEDVKELDRSSRIFLNGMNVGNVRKIDFDYEHLSGAVLTIELQKGLKLPKSTLGLVEEQLLTNSRIILKVPEGADMTDLLKSGDTIQSITQATMIQRMEEELMPNLIVLTSSVDSLVQDLRAVVSNPDIPEAIERVNKTAATIQASSLQVDRLLRDEVPSILSNVDSTSVALADFSARVNSVDIEKPLNDFIKVVADLQRVADQLNKSDNTMGLLLNDPALYKKLQDATISADSLLRDIQENPKRYVHFSIF
ncbi:MAG: MlaD family protein [Porphyromonas sp.]|nr:MlaD family protein [Porphyromonas sp.]